MSKASTYLLLFIFVILFSSCGNKTSDFPRTDGLYITPEFMVQEKPVQSYIRFLENGTVKETYVKPDQDTKEIMKILGGESTLEIPVTKFRVDDNRALFEYKYDEGSVGYTCVDRGEGKMTVIVYSDITKKDFERNYTFVEVDE